MPVKTIYNNLGRGTVATAFSHDAKYIVTIGQESPQVSRNSVCVCVCVCVRACLHVCVCVYATTTCLP